MGSYGITLDQFWTGPTGIEIAEKGTTAQLMALYLTSAPRATMIGLYYLPLIEIHRHLPKLSIARIKVVLDALAGDTDFARYDYASEHVWVVQMAFYRLGLHRGEHAALSPGDKKVIAVNNLYEAVRPNAFLGDFYERYRHALHLKCHRVNHNISGFEGVSKGLQGGVWKGHPRGIEASKQRSGSGTEIRKI